MSMADSFDADWLSLREGADAGSRSGPLARAFLAAVGRGGDRPILDLGCGTGANLRYLRQMAGRHFDAVAVDRDPLLLARLRADLPGVETVEADLTALDQLPWDRIGGVTCSALLDLVSAGWLDVLMAKLAIHRLPFLAALSVDGAHDFAPLHAMDAAVSAAFAEDQRRDKGFGGPSLGPLAPDHALAAARASGMRVEAADTPWRLSADGDGPLLRAFLQGYGLGRPQAATWLDDRLHALEASALSLRVGHRDILATL